MPDQSLPVPGLADLAGQFRWTAAILAVEGAPLCRALASGIADDAELLALAAQVRPGLRAVYPLLNAVHYLLLGEPDAPLARYYDSLTETPQPRDRAFPAFRDFCLDRREAIAGILARRTNQITTTARAATLLPALIRVAGQVSRPLTLIEIGCSAGLNLLVDRHGYDYGGRARLATPGAALTLSCAVRGDPPDLAAGMPPIARKIGIDLEPVDPDDGEACRWLEASLFPEWRDAREWLRRGLALRRETAMEVIRGDALAVLPALLDAADGPVSVLHSQCLYQWPRAARAALDDLLRQASLRRPLHRIAIENRLDQPLDPAWDRPEEPGFVPASILAMTYAGGEVATETLGQCDQYGRWIEWFA